MPRLALPLVSLFAALVAPLPCLAAAAVAADVSDRPNIIFIMVDDMGRDWVSCYGAAHPTPHVDARARDGFEKKGKKPKPEGKGKPRKKAPA